MLTSQPLNLHTAKCIRTVTAGTSTNQLVSLSNIIFLSPVSNMHKMVIQVEPNIYENYSYPKKQVVGCILRVLRKTAKL
jgi:hypothetical protein